ncbi:vacuolar protein 14 C-terminal Fig4p binding-domain-containing protein [Dipodascopsis tothii]|uniref:vacuolar protein 14 C-terminal Fig4p binding-domain-containing protein n=1 Tax=Dipodascopsis tothii TaxID=44089 RepID=UPI0034D01D5C
MNKEIQRGLNDRLYEKRKGAALELEKSIRQSLEEDDIGKIKAIVDQLCHDFAYAVHQPNARNGGLIGLAASAIALGPNVASYLEDIIPPVLACFGDQDARVRYYACESMYNIAKVAKGEILLYFNEIFDALCRLAADSELSVKNGADLLDRLIKDIVAEKAATYVSVVRSSPEPVPPEPVETDPTKPVMANEPVQDLAFSLARFIPLLTDRIYVINPFTRMFLVSWITLLDSIPDLEIVAYLPEIIGGLLNFLSDANTDVRVATQAALDGFLQEIKRIAELKRQVAETSAAQRRTFSGLLSAGSADEPSEDSEPSQQLMLSAEVDDEPSFSAADDIYLPGQDVRVDFSKVLEILLQHLDSTDQEIQLTVLHWIENFFEISPEDLLPFVPQFLSLLLPTMAHDSVVLRESAGRVNADLMELIMSLDDHGDDDDEPAPAPAAAPATAPAAPAAPATPAAAPATAVAVRPKKTDESFSLLPDESERKLVLDYPATVNALTLHFLNEQEETRVAALEWLIMLHKKASRRILAINDGTFPVLLKTLSDSSDLVVTKDLQLLAQISFNSEDDYFATFMHNLLSLFSTDRKLLETRGNLIIRQLCVSLNPERIYRSLAEIIEREEDVEFASIMIQNLNNNLVTAPELAALRKRLRNLTTRDGVNFFVSLFKSWCHNAVATFSLCLLAEAYEQAFHLLRIFADLEITVSLLIQVDKLIQLLESPVFTYLRLQLLEPERYPFLYKCLYGLLMLLPQSNAFATLRNRLNAVSAIGYMHIPGKTKSKIDEVRWSDLLDKFRTPPAGAVAVRPRGGA